MGGGRGGRGGAGGEEIRTGDKFLQVSGLVWGHTLTVKGCQSL